MLVVPCAPCYDLTMRRANEPKSARGLQKAIEEFDRRRPRKARRPAPLRWRSAGPEHPGRQEATLGYFVLNVEPASNVLRRIGGRWERSTGAKGWVISVDDGIADPSVPGTFQDEQVAKAEAERIARYTLARRPDRERGTSGYAIGALRPRSA